MELVGTDPVSWILLLTHSAFWAKWPVLRGYTLNNVRNPHGQRNHAAAAAVMALQQIDETVLN